MATDTGSFNYQCEVSIIVTIFETKKLKYDDEGSTPGLSVSQIQGLGHLPHALSFFVSKTAIIMLTLIVYM